MSKNDTKETKMQVVKDIELKDKDTPSTSVQQNNVQHDDQSLFNETLSESQKKKLDSTEKENAKQAAIKSTSEYNERERLYAELNNYKEDLLKQLEELRLAVNKITLKNHKKYFQELKAFFKKIENMKNKVIYNTILSPYIAIYLHYQFKVMLLEHNILKAQPTNIKDKKTGHSKSQNEEKKDLKSQSESVISNTDTLPSFVPHVFFPEENLRIILQDIVKTLSGNYEDVVRIQYFQDMLFPDKLFNFEKYISNETHNWLCLMAQDIITGKQDMIDDLYPDNEEKTLFLQHNQAIANGSLPCDFMSEQTIDYPRKTMDFMLMINRKADQLFEKTIQRNHFEALRQYAQEKMNEIDQHLSTSNKTIKELTESEKLDIAHIQSIIEGNAPFGYKIIDEGVETLQTFDLEANKEKNKNDL